jgi:hypothetical protein
MPEVETDDRRDDRRVGVLLANLGTPESPDRKAVARFLREFLSDPRVVDLPRYLWLPLLNLVIIPLRAGRSAAAYREIWRAEGSPLLVLTERLSRKLAAALDGRALWGAFDPNRARAAEGGRRGGGRDCTALPAVLGNHHRVHLRCGG